MADGSPKPARAGKGCSAFWCGRHEATLRVPSRSTSANPALALANNKKRAAVLGCLKVTDQGQVDLRYCPAHLVPGGDKHHFLPLCDDPVFTGALPGIQLASVLEAPSVFGQAVAAATARHGTDWGNHPGVVARGRPVTRTGSGSPKRGASPSRHGSPAKRGGSQSPGTHPRHGSASPPLRRPHTASPPHVAATPASVTARTGRHARSEIRADAQGGGTGRSPLHHLDLDATPDDAAAVIAQLRRELAAEKLRAETLEAANASLVEPLSYELLTGRLAGDCRSFVCLPADKLQCLVETCELLNADAKWEIALKQQAEADHLSYEDARAIGFRSSVALALHRCKTGATEKHIAHTFGIAHNQRKLVGLLFRVTIGCVNVVLERTVARIPDMFQLDRDELPAFKDPEFANVIITLDASERAARPLPAWAPFLITLASTRTVRVGKPT